MLILLSNRESLNSPGFIAAGILLTGISLAVLLIWNYYLKKTDLESLPEDSFTIAQSNGKVFVVEHLGRKTVNAGNVFAEIQFQGKIEVNVKYKNLSSGGRVYKTELINIRLTGMEFISNLNDFKNFGVDGGVIDVFIMDKFETYESEGDLLIKKGRRCFNFKEKPFVRITDELLKSEILRLHVEECDYILRACESQIMIDLNEENDK